MGDESVSVVIPTCDRPFGLLREAVDSVLAQTLPAIEIIVVDNGLGAVADVPSIARDASYYRLPARVGVSRARNFGAAMATGRYLAFLDDDDLWDERFLEFCMKTLKDKAVRAVYGRKDRLRDGVVERYKCPLPETLNIQSLLRRNPGTGGQNLLIEKELFWVVGGFDSRLRTSEDKALALELLLLNVPIGIAAEAVSILRGHDGQRLTDAKLRRLQFVWKYRQLYSVSGLTQVVTKLLKGAMKAKVKRSLKR